MFRFLGKIAPRTTMRLPLKMYLIMFISASVVLYQYHFYHLSSAAWVLTQNDAHNYRDISEREIQIKAITSIQNASNISIPVTNRHIRCSYADESLPFLYIITPTYKRPEQMAELTRMSHTLMLVPSVHWLVIEDAEERNPLVTELLMKSRLSFDHLVAPMPEQYKKKKKGPKPRGVSNRIKGLEWIRKNAKSGVLYFADDDNTYDLELFKEIRYTKRVSMFPVGLITKTGVSSPVVENGKLTGFYDGWIAGRKFPVDMAGFAVSVEFLLQRPKAIMPFKPGFEEDGFLRSLSPLEPKDIELLASNCTKILVWHTQTKKNEPSAPLDLAKYNNTNLVQLKKLIV